MDSGRRGSKDSVNPNIVTPSEEDRRFLDELFAGTIEQADKVDDDVCESPTTEERFMEDRRNLSEVLCEENNQLEHLDKEGTSDVLANQSSAANTSLSHKNTGNEILPSCSNVPETLEYPPSGVISHTSENHVCGSDHNYADTHFLNDRPCIGDHTYAAKPRRNILDSTESIPGPSHTEEIDTEKRNRLDPKESSPMSPSAIPYVCHVCGSLFTDNADFEDHLHTHSAETRHTSLPSDSLASHSKNISRKRPHVCQRCKLHREFSKRLSFLQNVRTNTGEKPHAICSKCGMGLS